MAWAALGLAAAAGAAAQGGPDELWDMSTRMEMAGMPAQAMQNQVCMKKGRTQPDSFSQDKNCKVTDLHTAGNKTSWKVVCTGRDAMTGTGEVTRTRDSMDGRIRMQGKSGGQAMDMTMVMQGKLAGGCTWEDPSKKAAAMTAQTDAMLAGQCKESMEKYQTMLFDGPYAACKAQKAEFCARVTKVSQSMRTPAGYRSAMKIEGLRGQGWSDAAKACAVKTAPIMAEACRGAVGGKDWSFVAEHCPVEAKKVAAEHCAGRDYTAVMASEYKEVCQRYARRGAGEQPAAEDQTQQQQQPATPATPAAPSATDAVKEGANKLRKLFGR
jgi:hypothetical protein